MKYIIEIKTPLCKRIEQANQPTFDYSLYENDKKFPIICTDNPYKFIEELVEIIYRKEKTRK